MPLKSFMEEIHMTFFIDKISLIFSHLFKNALNPGHTLKLPAVIQATQSVESDIKPKLIKNFLMPH